VVVLSLEVVKISIDFLHVTTDLLPTRADVHQLHHLAMIYRHAWEVLNHRAKDTVVVLRVPLLGLVVHPMILITPVLTAALLAMAILVAPLEVLRPRAAGETILLEMAESLEEAIGDLKISLAQRLAAATLNRGIEHQPTVSSQLIYLEFYLMHLYLTPTLFYRV